MFSSLAILFSLKNMFYEISSVERQKGMNPLLNHINALLTHSRQYIREVNWTIHFIQSYVLIKRPRLVRLNAEKKIGFGLMDRVIAFLKVHETATLQEPSILVSYTIAQLICSLLKMIIWRKKMKLSLSNWNNCNVKSDQKILVVSF